MKDRFIVSEASLQTDHGIVRLFVQEAAILGTLKKKQPRDATFADLASALWGMPERWPASWRDVLAHTVHTLRNKISEAESGLRIDSHYDIGYWLSGELEVVE